MRDKLLLKRAKQMRNKPTACELKLWTALRAKRFGGAKFRRQVVIGPYIADFACRTPIMLVVETDGPSHADTRFYDEGRTAFLEGRGYRVLRVRNDEVVENFDGVLFAIGEALRTPPLPRRFAAPPLP